jgi:membrane protein YqaA with SNARE-associated domain
VALTARTVSRSLPRVSEEPPATETSAEGVSPAPTEPEKRGWMRRAYDWTLKWADRPGGKRALFILAFAESSFFPIPPDVLLLALAVGAPTKAFRFALICSAGSVLGGIAGYGIGLWGYEMIGQPIVQFYKGEAVMEKIRGYYDQHGFLGILIAAITPIPYKVFTIASGLFKYNFVEFVVASVIGRSFRFFCVAAVIKYFGPTVKEYIEKYFNWFSWAFMVLLILGFIVLKMLKHH